MCLRTNLRSNHIHAFRMILTKYVNIQNDIHIQTLKNNINNNFTTKKTGPLNNLNLVIKKKSKSGEKKFSYL